MDQKACWPVQRLHVTEVEKAFVQVAIDLHAIIVLDGIDQLKSPSGFRIRSHDLHGPLPDIVVTIPETAIACFEQIEREVAKIYAIARNREPLSRSSLDGNDS